jgi:TldD protein
MQDLARTAADMLRTFGADYGDARVGVVDTEALVFRDGSLGTRTRESSLGFGIRALVDGAWGFAARAGLDPADCEQTVRDAIAIARSSARCRTTPIRLSPAEPVTAVWSTSVLRDPFLVPLSEKVGLLARIDAAMGAVQGVTVRESMLNFVRKHIVFGSTEGTLIDQTLSYAGAGYQAVAVKDGDFQVRSYPTSLGGQWETCGWEIVDRWPMVESAPRIAEEAVALLGAPPCPSGTMDLVVSCNQLGLQVHESCGHPTELDRALGDEAAYAGRSFLTPDKLGRLRYGSPIVHLTADSVSPRGCGTFGFDDEGTPAQSWDLVREGLFVGYLTSRETAPLIGLPASQGAMRAESWNRIPLIRMTNVSLQPGRGRLEELIADTEDGIYVDTNRSWSIDQFRYNFQFGMEAGWRIRKGKLAEMVRNPTYQGITPEFWATCDRICGPEEWVVWGVPNCGKGQPGQSMATGHGASPARFRSVRVGVANG